MDHGEGFYALRDKATALLGEVAVIEGFQPVARMWRYPSFADSFAWTVYRRADEWLVRRVQWELADMERFSDPLVGLKTMFSAAPTIHVRQITISNAAVAWFQKLSGLALPPPPPPLKVGVVRLDGEVCGLEMLDGETTRIEWRTDAEESVALRRWWMAMTYSLDREIEASAQ